MDNELKSLIHGDAQTYMKTSTLPQEYALFARQVNGMGEEEEEYDDMICMKKVVFVNEIVYDEEVVCKHETYKMCWDVQVSRYKTGMVSAKF